MQTMVHRSSGVVFPEGCGWKNIREFTFQTRIVSLITALGGSRQTKVEIQFLMSRGFLVANFISHFLLDLYGLSGYIHNQLAHDFPPAIVHPNKRTENSIAVAPADGFGLFLTDATKKIHQY